ncbi:MAG: hypothetical protein AB9M60_11070, partial [Leptothrix sp. (in: b-proteobacteria)]
MAASVPEPACRTGAGRRLHRGAPRAAWLGSAREPSLDILETCMPVTPFLFNAVRRIEIGAGAAARLGEV